MPSRDHPPICPPRWSGWKWVPSTPVSRMPSTSRMSRRSCTAYAGSTATASPVSRSPMRKTKLTIWRAMTSPCAKPRPESSWRKYRRSVALPPVGASVLSAIVTLSCIRAGHIAGGRVEPGHELFDLGLGPAQALIELVDQGRCPFQPADEHVDVHLSLFEEVHDRIELSARLREAQLLYRDDFVRVGHALPPASFSSTASTRLRTVPSAKRVTISCCSASPAVLRSRPPSAV